MKKDRILLHYGKEMGYYPTDPDPEVLAKSLADIVSDSGALWTLVSIPQFLWEMAEKFSYNVDSVKDWICGFANSHCKLIKFVPTSTIFIDIKTPYAKQDHLIRRLYVKKDCYYSHLHVKRDLLDVL